MISTALIGVSGFGQVHYDDLMRQTQRGTTRLLAATVINQAQEAAKCAALRAMGCELFTDYQLMLAKYRGQLDLCFIPTGIPLHRPMTIAALGAGANVYVEKPAAATIQDVLAMRHAALQANRFVAVGFQTIYARETMVMKNLILSGALGKIHAIKCRGLWPRYDSYYARNNWAGKLKLGDDWVLDSPFNNAIAHQLNMICFLAGQEPNRSAELASIEAELYRAHAIESADTACMRILTSTGLPLYFYVTHCPEQNLDPEIVVEGSRGHIHWTFTQLNIHHADGTTTQQPCEIKEELRDSIHAHLRQRLTDPHTLICDLDIAGAHILAVNGAHDSAPVHALDPRYIQRTPAGDSIQTIIPGLDEIIAQAFAEHKLFSALAVPWAVPGQVVKLSGYDYFPTRLPG